MKVTRQIKAAINRRANEVVRQLLPVLVARLQTQIEVEEMGVGDIEDWWPDELEPVLCNWRAEARLNGAPADVCANCDCPMPDGCEGTFRDEASCRWAKESAHLRPRGADPGFDATDHLAGF